MSEALLRIDLSLSVPAYRQIADGLRALLVAGSLAIGERLPPVRQLANDLGVHHNTVAEAYRRLSQEGWLQLVRGRGAVVCQRQFPTAGPDVAQSIGQRLEALIVEAVAAGADRTWLARELRRLAARMEEP